MRVHELQSLRTFRVRQIFGLFYIHLLGDESIDYQPVMKMINFITCIAKFMKFAIWLLTFPCASMN